MRAAQLFRREHIGKSSYQFVMRGSLGVPLLPLSYVLAAVPLSPTITGAFAQQMSAFGT